jgi:hypothetical protein
MPLNKSEGERIEGFENEPFHIEPVESYARTPAFEEAARYCAEQLAVSGAERPVRFYPDDVSIQRYHAHKPWPVVIFLFCKPCRGGLDRTDMSVERISWYKFDEVKPTHETGGRA